MKDHDKEKRKGQFQHKIFKFIILLIVIAFLCLIFSFIYIEFFGSRGSNSKLSAISYEKNILRYDYLHQNDLKFYSNYNKRIPLCDTDRFYYSHISKALPCIVKYETANEEHKQYIIKAKELYKKNNVSSNTLGLLPLVTKYLEYSEMTIFNAYNELKKGVYADDKAKFYIQIDGDSNYHLAPISIINDISPVKNETYKQFNTIYSKVDLSNKDTVMVMKGDLNEGDMVYVPSYFFIQCNWVSKSEFSLLRFEYNSVPRHLNNLFTVLFDDNQIDDDIIDEY